MCVQERFPTVAVVTHHAIRRYAERADGFAWMPPEEMDDKTAVSVLERLGYPVEAVRAKIARMAEIGVRHRANAVSVARVNLVLRDNHVVTCVPKPYRTPVRHGPRPPRGEAAFQASLA